MVEDDGDSEIRVEVGPMADLMNDCMGDEVDILSKDVLVDKDVAGYDCVVNSPEFGSRPLARQ